MTDPRQFPDPLEVGDHLGPRCDRCYWEGRRETAEEAHGSAAILVLCAGIILGIVLTLAVAALVNAAPRSGLQSGDSFSAGRSEAPHVPPEPDVASRRGVDSDAGSPTRAVASQEPSVVPPPPAAPVVLDDGGGIDSALMAGTASWYDVGNGLYGAVPSYRWGDARYPVRVCRLDNPARCVTVTILDFCGCPGSRAIDLSRQAFARLESPSRGLVAVTVETGGGPDATLPATDR